MRTVTKYAMLALFTISFIALNNCGNQSGSKNEEAFSQDQNGPASDFAILGGAPIGYPGLYSGILPDFSVETACGDGVDNNGNGLTDCEDFDCQIYPQCSVWGPPLEEITNESSLTVYPNGLIVPEEIALLKARGADDDDAHGWQRDNFFSAHQKDCWIDPRYMDPYFFVPLGEPLLVGPDGPIGPQLFPEEAFAYSGPFGRRYPTGGLFNECEFATDLMFHHVDDDNGAGAGAAGDTDDDDGGVEDDI